MPQSADERSTLGEALSGRIDRLEHEGQLPTGLQGAPESTRAHAVETMRSFARWLGTGTADVGEIDVVARIGADELVREALSHRDGTKLCFVWRDSVVRMLREEASRLRISHDVLEGAVDAAGASADSFLIRIAEHYDRQRREIQAELDESRALLVREATHDPLTGVANRALFLDVLRQSVQACRDCELLAVLYMDLDHFKAVNDEHGHGVGDTALRIAAERIGKLLRTTDTLGRLGGDEFVAICRGLPEPDAQSVARRLAQRVNQSIAQPIWAADAQLSISVSIGVAIGRCTTSGGEDMLTAADRAMYRAKQNGRNGREITVL
jgi:diguanylate cyclase (GGDEF)-like protein